MRLLPLSIDNLVKFQSTNCSSSGLLKRSDTIHICSVGFIQGMKGYIKIVLHFDFPVIGQACFMVASPRLTCAIFILSNKHLDMPLLCSGKGEVLTRFYRLR